MSEEVWGQKEIFERYFERVTENAQSRGMEGWEAQATNAEALYDVLVRRVPEGEWIAAVSVLMALVLDRTVRGDLDALPDEPSPSMETALNVLASELFGRGPGMWLWAALLILTFYQMAQEAGLKP